jgi:hygromycin-B 7''-O-kinase
MADLNTEIMNFDELRKDDTFCRNINAEVCHRNGLDTGGKRIRDGSRILHETPGNLIVKIFARDEKVFCDNERLFLERLCGRTTFSVPEVVFHGTQKGYPYIIMTKLTGMPFKTVWNDLDMNEKLSITGNLGHVLKELHTVPVSLAEGSRPVWEEFIESQKKNLESNHRSFGLPEKRIAEIARIIQDGSEIEKYNSPVVCHTEIMPEHLFLERDRGSWRVSGMIDFEPSMLAVPEYEFCAVGIFITCGSRELFTEFLHSYEYNSSDCVDSVTRMLLLHRYSYMEWFISTLPSDLQNKGIMSMGEYWFGRA